MKIQSSFLIILYLVLPGALAIPRLSFCQQPGYLADDKVMIFFDDQLKKAAEEILEFYPQLKLELKEKTGWGISYRPQIILFGNSADFQRTVNNPYILAYAVPAGKLMVIDYSKLSMDPFKVETTIEHELCHLILHEHIQASNLPRWLDEGIAQWACGGLAEVIYPERESLLDSAVLSGRFIPFRALRDGFPGDKNSFLLSYEQSRSMVEFIVKQYGEEGLRDLLNKLKNGHPLDEAVLNTFSVSSAELENEWRNHLRRQAAWLTYFINHLYEFLFILGALLLCYGFIKIRLRKRTMIDDDWPDSGG